MNHLSKETRGRLVPAASAVIIAVVGTVTLFFMAFGPANDIHSTVSV
jgi:hypothetical protein